MPFDPNAFLRENFEELARCYHADVSALGEEGMRYQPGGEARSGYDILAEVIAVNHRVATRLRSEDPGPWPLPDGQWMRATPEQRDLGAIGAAFDASVAALLNSLPDANDDVPVTQGTRSAFEVAMHALTHMEYHLAQLNYIQSLRGDAQEHWG